MIIRINFTYWGMRVLKALFKRASWWGEFESDHWRFYYCETRRGYKPVPDVEFNSVMFIVSVKARLGAVPYRVERVYYMTVLKLMIKLGVNNLGTYSVYATYEGEVVISRALYVRGTCRMAKFV